VNKKFVNEGSITKFTKILCHENLELYGIAVCNNIAVVKLTQGLTTLIKKRRLLISVENLERILGRECK